MMCHKIKNNIYCYIINQHHEFLPWFKKQKRR